MAPTSDLPARDPLPLVGLSGVHSLCLLRHRVGVFSASLWLVPASEAIAKHCGPVPCWSRWSSWVSAICASSSHQVLARVGRVPCRCSLRRQGLECPLFSLLRPLAALLPRGWLPSFLLMEALLRSPRLLASPPCSNPSIKPVARRSVASSFAFSAKRANAPGLRHWRMHL